MAKGSGGGGRANRSGGSDSGPRSIDAGKVGMSVTRVERMKYPGTRSTSAHPYPTFEFRVGDRVQRFRANSLEEAVRRVEQENNVRLSNVPKAKVQRVDDAGNVLRKDERGMWRAAR